MISDQYAIEVRLKRDEVPSFDGYPFSLPAIRNLDVLPLHRAVTLFVGENGSGKSTLLEAIAVARGAGLGTRGAYQGSAMNARAPCCALTAANSGMHNSRRVTPPAAPLPDPGPTEG